MPEAASWPVADGAMADRLEHLDWSATPFGPLAGWPAGLRMAAGLVLRAPGPAALVWGRAYRQLGNEGWRRLAGEDRPGPPGRPLAAALPSVAAADLPPPAAAEAGGALRAALCRAFGPRRDILVLPLREDTEAGFLCLLGEDTAMPDSEARLRRFGEASLDVLWIRDARDLRLDYLSAAFETVFGVPVARMIARGDVSAWLDLILPEDRDRARQVMERVRQGEDVAFEYRIQRPDGQIRVLRNTDFPIRGPDGKVDRIGGIGRDITCDREREERLIRSEDRLRSAVEVGGLGLWDWDLATGEIHWSDQHFRMEGYEPGEVQPGYDAWAARLHPEDRAATEAALARARAQGGLYEREFRVRHPDGTVRWLHARGRFFPDATGQPRRMVGAMSDMTERRQLEDRQKILIAELQHRSVNLIGVIGAIAERSARAGGDAEGFLDIFLSRLDALARAQQLLSRLGRDDRPGFGELLDSALAALDTGHGQITLDGPPEVPLRAASVQLLALALHELAINAQKHGALAAAGGHLTVRWRLDRSGPEAAPWLHVDWRETGVALAGRPPPSRTGQGRDLIERALPYQLGAQTAFRLEPDGLHCTLAVPLGPKAGRGRGTA